MPETDGRIAAAMERARRENRSAFIPYVTAGDPSLAATADAIRALARAGADVIECGVPFSDPVGDGPELQAAAARGIASEATLEEVLRLLTGLSGDRGIPPVLLFSYLNPILAMGTGRFARRARESGVAGALVVDLPVEEAGEFLAAARREGLETVFLASPTTSDARLARIAGASRGFVYLVARTGVTGTRPALAGGLDRRVARLRAIAPGKAVAAGFGISTPEQAAAVAGVADGVIVGSALAGRIAAGGPGELESFARGIARALSRNPARAPKREREGEGACSS